MDNLEKFFQNAEEQIKIKALDMSPVDKLDSDVLPTHGDKRKLPWPEPNISNQSVLQNNHEVKIERCSVKVSKIDGAVGVDQKKMGTSYTSSEAWQISSKSSDLAKKKSSPIPKSFSTVCQLPSSHKIQYNLEGKADIQEDYEVDIDVIDLEECNPKPRYAKLTIFNPSEDRSQQPTLVEETSAETPVASPSYHSEANTSAALHNDEYQVVDMSASRSTANRNFSCVCTSAATPERTSNRDCHLEHESVMNRSVNSHCQKKRRFSSPISCCTGTEHSDPSSKSFCDTDCAVSLVSGHLKRTDGSCCKSTKMSWCENVKLERNHKPVEFSPKKSAQKKLLIRCTRCKIELGLQKDGFLVSCSLSLSSKFYLAYLLRHGLSSADFPQVDISASPPVQVNVMVCDTSSLNQMILSKFSIEGSAHHSGVWSESDGCVYKPITCPFCPCGNACATVLGVQVLATDVSNLQSLNKVLLFADCLDVKHEASNEQVVSTPGASNSMSPPPVIDLEAFAYKPLKKDPVPLNTRRFKLRLPNTNKSTTGA